MATEKSLEQRARRAARRAGLMAIKGRSRTWNVDDHGCFMLVDPQTNMIVAGQRFDMTETEVIEYCREDLAEAGA